MTAGTTPPPISIIGIGCRVPGASGVDELWRLLVRGRDAVGDGEGLPGIGEFDNSWFAISEREAAVMDPQQRLALEVAVEAIDDAGIGYRIGGSDAAVLFGACGFDHGAVVLGDGGYDAPYAVTGSALSIIANRISYALNLHGPSVVLDSACSSSLAALDLAVRLLADGSVPYAIVGGVNLALLPHTSDYLAQGGFLAADGRCKPFDADADGYARGDGATVLVLQRRSDAHRDGNRVYAEILGTAVGSDGRSNGLYAPNGRAQQRVIRAAWERAGVDVRSAGYFECHGTGTQVGDAVEVEALASVLGAADDEQDAGGAWIGSIKSNIGHLEAAAGVTGVAKAALCLRSGIIAPTINFRRENPLLRLAERGLRVPTEPIEWGGDARYAGVSSFGFGGTNAHAVLRSPTPPSPSRELRPPILIGLTGRDGAELRDTAGRWAERLSAGPPATDSAGWELGLLAAAGRVLPQAVRGALLAVDREDAISRLRGVASGSGTSSDGAPMVRRRGRVLFLFSGQGGQHARMGRELAARYPVFAQALAEAADAVTDAGGPRVWTPRHGFAHSVTATERVQPALFVYQVALARLLAAWGVEPDAVVGHSLGEIAAAVVAEAISLPDAAQLVTVRARQLATLSGRGMMAMLEATPEQARRLVEPLHAEVAVAAVNGPRAVVVSGATRYMETLMRRARRRQLYVRPVPVDFAAHSPQVRSLIDDFTAELRAPVARAPRVPVFSTARPGTVIESAALTLDYWIDNLCGTVDLDSALDVALSRGYTAVVEISPHPVLTPAVRDYPELAEGVFPAARRDDETTELLHTIGAMYVRGRPVEWSMQGSFPGPVSQRTWRRRTFPLLTRNAIDPSSDRFDDHAVAGVPTVPAVYWVRRLLNSIPRPGRLTDFAVRERTDATDLPAIDYHVGADLRVMLGPVTVAEAQTGPPATPAEIVGWMRTADAHRADPTVDRVLDVGEFYTELRNRGLDYGPSFRALSAVRRGTRSAIGTFGASPLSTAILDSCLHVIAAAAHDLLPPNAVPLPTSIAAAWVTDAPQIHLTEAHAFLREYSTSTLLCDVIAVDTHDAPAVALLGVRIHCAGAVLDPDAWTDSKTQTSPSSRTSAHPRTTANTRSDTDAAANADPWDASVESDAAARDSHCADSGSAPGVAPDEDSRAPAASRPGAGPEPAAGTTQHTERERRSRQSPVRTATADRTDPAGGRFDPERADLTRGAGAAGWGEALGSPLRGVRPFAHRTEWGRTAGYDPTVATAPEWAASILREEYWAPRADPEASVAQRDSRITRALVVGESELAVAVTRTIGREMTAQRVAREPDAAAPLLAAAAGGRRDTAIVLIWPRSRPESGTDEATPVDLLGRAVILLQQVITQRATASVTVVLRDAASVEQSAVAALVRTLQLESGRIVRLVWSDGVDSAPIRDLALADDAPDEVRIERSTSHIRRFRAISRERTSIAITPEGTYVVTGGLGALGAAAVRWLLDRGARDVVVLTRRPRPLPPLLEGAEDRVVVVRCDVADRADLANALADIRACGSTIRGIVHSAGMLHDAEFDAVTPELLARHFEPKVTAAISLLELTAADPIDFTVLFSSATGLLGAPGQGAYAAANAALDAVARRRADSRVTSIAWGSWTSGLARAAGGAAHLRAAGITAFDVARGMGVLTAALGLPQPVALALDYTPTSDSSVVARRLRNVLTDAAAPTAASALSIRTDSPRAPGTAPFADPNSPPDVPGHTAAQFFSTSTSTPVAAGTALADADIRRIVRAAVAGTLARPVESIDPDTDFANLELSSLLAIDLRRRLEMRLGVRIATAELFDHPSVSALSAALAVKVLQEHS